LILREPWARGGACLLAGAAPAAVLGVLLVAYALTGEQDPGYQGLAGLVLTVSAIAMTALALAGAAVCFIVTECCLAGWAPSRLRLVTTGILPAAALSLVLLDWVSPGLNSLPVWGWLLTLLIPLAWVQAILALWWRLALRR
jgi:hypothetical protein